MKDFIIVSGGKYSPIGSIGGAFVIACDRGYEYLKREGITPNLVIGDFDSYSGEISGGIEVIKLPKEKDDTDTLYAVKSAIKMGAKKITIKCGAGNRLDHLVANVQTCVYAKQFGVDISIDSIDTKIYFLKDQQMCFEKQDGFSFSLFSITDSAKVSVSGAKYELQDAILNNSFPLGVSNEWKNQTINVSVFCGIVMIILSKM